MKYEKFNECCICGIWQIVETIGELDYCSIHAKKEKEKQKCIQAGKRYEKSIESFRTMKEVTPT